MENRQKGGSIEAKKAILTARKIKPRPPEKHKLLGKKVFKFDIIDKAEASVHIPLKEEEQKAIPLFENSLKGDGDTIYGEKIKGFSLKHVPDRTVINRSGKHKAGTVTTSDYTFAEIELVYIPLLNSIKNS